MKTVKLRELSIKRVIAIAENILLTGLDASTKVIAVDVDYAHTTDIDGVEVVDTTIYIDSDKKYRIGDSVCGGDTISGWLNKYDYVIACGNHFLAAWILAYECGVISTRPTVTILPATAAMDIAILSNTRHANVKGFSQRELNGIAWHAMQNGHVTIQADLMKAPYGFVRGQAQDAFNFCRLRKIGFAENEVIGLNHLQLLDTLKCEKVAEMQEKVGAYASGEKAPACTKKAEFSDLAKQNDGNVLGVMFKAILVGDSTTIQETCNVTRKALALYVALLDLAKQNDGNVLGEMLRAIVAGDSVITQETCEVLRKALELYVAEKTESKVAEKGKKYSKKN